MYDTLTRQITDRLSQNLRHPLGIAAPLGRQLLDGLRGLRKAESVRSSEGVESAAAAASAENLAGWGRRNPRLARSLPAGSASMARALPLRGTGSPTGVATASIAAAVASAPMPRERSAGAEDPRRLLTTAAPAQTRPAARAARCTVDPIDARRTVISGRMSDVCDALDRLIALQAAQSASGARFAI